MFSDSEQNASISVQYIDIIMFVYLHGKNANMSKQLNYVSMYGDQWFHSDSCTIVKWRY